MNHHLQTSTYVCSLRSLVAGLLAITLLFLGLNQTLAQSNLIVPTTLGGFEQSAPSGIPISDFSANGWQVVNGASNQWFVGNSGTPFAGSNHAFTGPNSSTWSGQALSSVNHFYADVTVPLNEPILQLSFRFKVSTVHANADYLRVHLVTPTDNPVAGVLLSTGELDQIDGTTTYSAYNYTTQAVPGTRIRLVFSFRTNNTTPSAAAAIDNIALNSFPASSFSATATGGFWNSPDTWVGGVVPPPGNNITIPAGSRVLVNQPLNYFNLTLNGGLQWFNNNDATFFGNIVVGAAGNLFLSTANQAGQTINIGGNFTNNGTVNATADGATMNFNGISNVSLIGTGTFIGTGGRGVIRNLRASNRGSFTINPTANLTITEEFVTTANSVVTNNKVRIDNAADVFESSVNQVVLSNTGSNYATAPVVHGQSVVVWPSGGSASSGTRYHVGGQVYLCTSSGIFDVAPPVNTTPLLEVNGTASLLWIGPLGNLGASFQVNGIVAGSQYYCGNNLYLALNSGNASELAPPTHITGSSFSGAVEFRYIGSPARASLNWNAATQNVRSLNVTTGGSGYIATPSVVISNTGSGSGATALAVIMSVVGPDKSSLTKSTVTSYTGTIDIRSSAGPTGAGVGNVTVATRGYYTVAPTVGFTAPTENNLVTAQGSNYNAAVPTVNVVGGTPIGTGTPLTFQVNVALGRVISVYCTGGTQAYIVPPTLTLTGGGGTGATIGWGTSWPTATATLNADGILTGFNVTNAGHGYENAPVVVISDPLPGEFGASNPTCRIHKYGLKFGVFAPQTTAAVANAGVAIPVNGRLHSLEALTGGAIILQQNIELYGVNPLTLTNGFVDGGVTFTINCSNPKYLGTTGNENSFVYNGLFRLSYPGGQANDTRTFPVGGGNGGPKFCSYTTGASVALNSGYTFTGLTVDIQPMPTGALPTGYTYTGVRSMRMVQSGTGSLVSNNAGRSVTMSWNKFDNLIGDESSVFMVQGVSPTSAYSIRSAPVANAPLPDVGTRTSVTVATPPATIIPNNFTTMFFCFARANTFVVPPALAYNVAVNSPITYNSILGPSFGGDASGTPFPAWTPAGGNVGDEEFSDVISLVVPGNAFTYQGQPVTGFRVHTNGFLQLENGTSLGFPTSAKENNFSNKQLINVITPFWEDLTVSGYSAGNPTLSATNRDLLIRYKIVGTAPNRVVTVEYGRMTINGFVGPDISFQIELNESNNSITFNYGDMQLHRGTQNLRYSYSCGIKGRYNSSYPTAGQVFALQFENTSLFANQETQLANYGANGLALAPEPRSRYVFTPGAYVPPSPPLPNPPLNDDIANAKILFNSSVFPDNIAWDNVSDETRLYTTRFATASPNTLCAGPTGAKDVWFQFTAQEPLTTIRVYPSGGFIPRIQVLDNSLNTIGCQLGTAGTVLDANLTGLTIGANYYIRVFHNQVGTTATFQSGFVSINTVPNISIVNPGTNYVVATPTTPGGPSGAKLSFSGGPGNSAVGAITNVAAGQVTGLTFDGGNNYLGPPAITALSPDWGITGEFGILVYAPPVNDNCAGARNLTNVNNLSCVPGQNQILGVSSRTASLSPEAAPTCDLAAGPDDDLWFRFVSTGARPKITVKGNSGYDPVVQIWSGTTCTTKLTISPPTQGCLNLTGANGTEELEFSSVVGRIHYIRVYHSGAGSGPPGANFDICVTVKPDIDIASTSVVSPLNASCGNSNQNVTVRIQNQGGLTLNTGTVVTVTATITGPGGPYILTNPFALPSNLAPNAFVNVSLGNFNMSAFGTYNFNINSVVAGDGNVANNTLPSPFSIIINLISVPPDYIDGLNTQGPWVIRQTAGTGNWVFANAPQRSGSPSSPFVPFDEGTGYLFFNSYSFTAGTRSIAISPCFQLPPTPVKAQFRMKRDNVFMSLNDRVNLKVSTDGGNTFSASLILKNTTIDKIEVANRPFNEFGPAIQWHTYEADLGAYLGQTIRIGLEGFSGFGNNMMVDDFRVLPGAFADVQPVNIVSPTGNTVCNPSTMNVVARFKNNSANAVNNVPYTVNVAGAATPNVFNGTIPSIDPFSEIDITVGNINITGTGTLNFNVSASLPGDGIPANNNIGPISVPIRTGFTYGVALDEPLIIAGAGTSFTGSGTLGAVTANLVNSEGYIIPSVGTVGGPPIEIDAPLNVTSLGNLAANNISSVMVNFTHTRLQEVTLILIDPQGVQRTLFQKRGGTSDFLISTRFSATAVTPIASGTAPFTGLFLPEQALSGFSSAPGTANGTWTLRVIDDSPGFEGGELLNFTLTFSNGFSTALYTCPTCPVNFPASAINPAVNLDHPDNPFGQTYPIGSYPIRFDIVDRQGCNAFNNFNLQVIAQNVWLGVNPGADNWQDPANWLAAPRPPAIESNVLIPNTTPFSPNLTSNGFVNNITSKSAKINVSSGAALEVHGDWNASPTSEVTGDGEVEFVGPGIQNINGATDFSNVRLDKTTGNVTVNGKMGVIGTLSIANITSPFNVLPTAELIFRSTPTATGRLGVVPFPATINGIITMERHVNIPTPEAGRWHFIGAPVSGSTISDWARDFRVAGPTASVTGPHYGGIPYVWTIEEPERATIFNYNEATHQTRFDTVQKIGWKVAQGGNIIPSLGYRVWIDRYSLSKGKFDTKGAPVTGLVNFPTLTRNEFGACVPASFDCFNSANDFYRGWNLIANPYPSDIDWDATGPDTWTKPTQMLNAYFRWNGEGKGYGFYVGGSGVWTGTLPAPANPNVIPSSQAFFVSLSQPGTYTANLSINENAKVNVNGTFLRTHADQTNRLVVELRRANEKPTAGFRGVVSFDENATDGLDAQGDLKNMGGGAYSFSFPVDNSELAFTTYGALKSNKTVPLSTSFGRNTGNYKFSFNNLPSFDQGVTVYLFDKATNEMFRVTEGAEYLFTVNKNNIRDYGRFELVFDTRGGGFVKGQGFEGLTAFPNPTEMNGTTTLLFTSVSSNGKALVTVFDAMGKEVFEQTVDSRNEGVTEFKLNHKLGAGAYQVKVEGNKGLFATKLIIK